MKVSEIRKRTRKGDYTMTPFVMLKDIRREELKKEDLEARKARASSAKSSKNPKAPKNKD